MMLNYFDVLAKITALIDTDKNEGGTKIIMLTDRGIELISKMNSESLCIGELQNLFSSLRIMHINHEPLTELIDKIHNEIGRLLGDDEWRIYAPD